MRKDFKYTFVSYIYFDIACATIAGVHIRHWHHNFLILCLVHTGVYWKKMNIFRFFVLGLIFEVFLTGLFGMIFKQYPIIFVNSYDQFYCSCFLFGNTYFCI